MRADEGASTVALDEDSTRDRLRELLAVRAAGTTPALDWIAEEPHSTRTAGYCAFRSTRKFAVRTPREDVPRIEDTWFRMFRAIASEQREL